MSPSFEPTERDYYQYSLERSLAQKARERLEALGVMTTHIHGERYQERAVDLLCCVPPHGRFLSIELKVGRNKATPSQEAYLERTRKAGGVAAVAWTVADCLAAVREAMELK